MKEDIDIVTGGAGFIGSHLVDRLLVAGRRVRVIDSFVTGRFDNLEQHKGNDRLEVIERDVLDIRATPSPIKDADRVFHLAARADVVPSIEVPEEYFDANTRGTLAVLEAAREGGVRRFLYAASSSCYGVPREYPTSEDAPIDCRYPYALTKYLGEQLVLHWAHVYGLPALSLRLFNVYGPRARSGGQYGAVFGVFLAQLVAGEPLTVVGDGTQTRDFTYVDDVVDALVRAAESDRIASVYNVGSGKTVSVNELVRLLGSPSTTHLPKRPGEPDCTWADTTRIVQDLGWTAKTELADGVATMMRNLDNWRDAPVWTADAISSVTERWFHYLGDDSH